MEGWVGVGGDWVKTKRNDTQEQVRRFVLRYDQTADVSKCPFVAFGLKVQKRSHLAAVVVVIVVVYSHIGFIPRTASSHKPGTYLAAVQHF